MDKTIITEDILRRMGFVQNPTWKEYWTLESEVDGEKYEVEMQYNKRYYHWTIRQYHGFQLIHRFTNHCYPGLHYVSELISLAQPVSLKLQDNEQQ